LVSDYVYKFENFVKICDNLPCHISVKFEATYRVKPWSKVSHFLSFYVNFKLLVHSKLD
jgi:hypothetical protein